MNRVTEVGRMTKDADLRYTANGTAVANFTIAVDNPHKKDETFFFNCVAWRKQAENLANYMRKGSQIGVDGHLQSRSFDNSEGKRVFVTEIVADYIQFLESKGDKQSQSNNQQSNGQQNQQPQDGDPIDISDDELPF